MKTVFLDAETFNIDTPSPSAVSAWQHYDFTEQNDDVILERLADAEIVLVNKVQLTREILVKLPKLKMVQITATGMNNVDIDACAELGIVCTNVSGYAEHSVPEHAFALLLNLTRNVSYYHQSVHAGRWTASRQFCLLDEPNRDLRGKTLGIIGYGTTGKRIAEIANVFGMTVLVAEHRDKPPRNADYTAFDDVLARADVISLHCPLTPATEKLIDAEVIAKMQRAPIVLNLARGGVVDEDAVAEAITTGKLSGFGTDVLSTEPPKADNPILALTQRANVAITPHNAWASVEAQESLWHIACEQVNAFIGN